MPKLIVRSGNFHVNNNIASDSNKDKIITPGCTSAQASVVPYSGKLSRDKTFTNLWTIRFRGENFCGFTTDRILCKVGHTHFRGENFHEWHQIREIRESFLPRNFPTTRHKDIYGFSQDTA